MPLITDDEEKARSSAKTKVRVVKIQVEDSDLVNFITGGMTGVKAYMTGKIKVRGDLMLAQRLEEVFEKAGGRKVNTYESLTARKRKWVEILF